MLNPNQDTGVDDIFRQHTEATSLIDTSVTAIMEPSFTAQHVDSVSSAYNAGALDVAVQLKYDRIQEESTTANQQFLETIDDGMKKIIKEQVKKEVSKIIPKVEKFVTDQLESEVLVRSSKEANTSHAVAANLSELELKKILIDKMKANNSINRTDIQRQLYKALVERMKSDKILLDTYGDTVTIKRPRDGADDDEEPSAGTDRGSKRRRSGKEPASTSAPTIYSSRDAKHSTDVFKGPSYQEFKTGVQEESSRISRKVYKATTEKLYWINPEGRQYRMISDQPLPLIQILQGLHVMHHLITSSITTWNIYVVVCQAESTLLRQNSPSLGGLTLGQEAPKFYAIAALRESARDSIQKERDIAFTKFKEGDFHRLRIQDIEDMLLLLVQGKVTNLSVEEQQEAYPPLPDPRGFIYENKDKKNRLMRIDELHKFSDGTLDDVRTALNDRLKGIRMEYLPQTFWSQRDKANAGAMIQAIDKRLKTRRIMRSLERFVGGRPYGGDLRLLQRTI
ncbi:hypothetical protein Tco_0952869 [Tanacetum coccineum]|uniref:Uncharacterized protein n=1 Tax=Tanacetum coccineum TaxID=301880 RepID=A0ABQ5E3U4_9ASTR